MDSPGRSAKRSAAAGHVFVSLLLLLALGCANHAPTLEAQKPLNLCGEDGRGGVRAAGTWEEPRQIPYLPFADEGELTAGAVATAHRYTCAPDAHFDGHEQVFALQTSQAGDLRVDMVPAEAGEVGVFLLPWPASTHAPGVGEALSCTAVSRAFSADGRSAQVLEAPALPAGTWRIVVASTTGASGAFYVAVDLAVPDVWRETRLAPGLVLRQLSSPDLFGGPQSVRVLDTDLSEPGLTLAPILNPSCRTVGQAGAAAGAVAGINGGYFDANCQSESFVKADGHLLSPGRVFDSSRVMGWGQAGDGNAPVVRFDQVPADADWSSVTTGIGGWPSLVNCGRATPWPTRDSTFFIGPNPRTAVGVDAEGHVLLVTVDGRTSAGAGLSIQQTADLLVSLGATEAINLDGGGSTTLWVRGCGTDGVLNSPSDDGDAGPWGSRPVSDGLYVWSRPTPADSSRGQGG
jgi:hypothetical protein